MDVRSLLVAGDRADISQALGDLVGRLVAELGLGWRVERIAQDRASYPGETLHALQPLGLVLMAGEPVLRPALLGVSAYDRDLPVLLATGSDPHSLGVADAVEKRCRLRGLSRVIGWPTISDLTSFLFRAGRHGKTGSLMPMT